MRKVLFLLAFATSIFIANHSNASAQNYQAEYQQLQAQVRWCQAQYNRYSPAQRAQAAMQGYVIPMPQCQAYMPQWISRMAFLEAQMYRRQSGDNRTDFCDIVAVPGCIRRY